MILQLTWLRRAIFCSCSTKYRRHHATYTHVCFISRSNVATIYLDLMGYIRKTCFESLLDHRIRWGVLCFCFVWLPARKSWDSISIRWWPLPSKFSPFHHSFYLSTFLSLCYWQEGKIDHKKVASDSTFTCNRRKKSYLCPLSRRAASRKRKWYVQNRTAAPTLQIMTSLWKL
jgi:hypothetical protein